MIVIFSLVLFTDPLFLMKVFVLNQLFLLYYNFFYNKTDIIKLKPGSIFKTVY